MYEQFMSLLQQNVNDLHQNCASLLGVIAPTQPTDQSGCLSQMNLSAMDGLLLDETLHSRLLSEDGLELSLLVLRAVDSLMNEEPYVIVSKQQREQLKEQAETLNPGAARRTRAGTDRGNSACDNPKQWAS